MNNHAIGNRCLIGILTLTVLTMNLAAQTAIVNAAPLREEAESADFMADVDSGIMEYLFDKGYIIFSQTAEESPSALASLGRQTGADIVISWSMDTSGLTGSLIDCRTGEQSSPQRISRAEFQEDYKDQHDMYAAMGVRLCRQLIPEDWN